MNDIGGVPLAQVTTPIIFLLSAGWIVCLVLMLRWNRAHGRHTLKGTTVDLSSDPVHRRLSGRRRTVNRAVRRRERVEEPELAALVTLVARSRAEPWENPWGFRFWMLLFATQAVLQAGQFSSDSWYDYPAAGFFVLCIGVLVASPFVRRRMFAQRDEVVALNADRARLTPEEPGSNEDTDR